MVLRPLGEHSFHLSLFTLYWSLGNPIFHFSICIAPSANTLFNFQFILLPLRTLFSIFNLYCSLCEHSFQFSIFTFQFVLLPRRTLFSFSNFHFSICNGPLANTLFNFHFSILCVSSATPFFNFHFSRFFGEHPFLFHQPFCNVIYFNPLIVIHVVTSAGNYYLGVCIFYAEQR